MTATAKAYACSLAGPADRELRFIVPNIAGPARVVPLASLVDKGFSLAALRQAAQRGRLEAHQGPDGIWRSSRRAVEDYQRIKNSRRPKSEKRG